MDNFQSKDFYGHSLFADPQLRTTARNYEFKYNSSDNLERVINRVKIEREIKKSRDLKTRNRVAPPTSGKNRPTYPKQNSQPSTATRVPGDSQVGKSSSRETIVKVMSDAEIEAMISQAILSSPYTPLSSNHSETSVSLRDMPSEASRSLRTHTHPGRRIEQKYPIKTEELILSQQPQWVQIKPAQKAVANVFDLQGSSSNTETVETVLDLTEDRSVNDMMPLDTRTFSMIGKSSSDDYILNNNDNESDNDNGKDGGDTSSPDSPMSFGIESPLNDCERAEMLRVLGHVLPHIPAITIDGMDSQDESLYSDSIEDEQEQELSSDEHECKDTQQPHEVNESYRGQQQSRREKHQVTETCTVKSVSTSRSDENHSPKKHPATPIDKRMKKQIEILKQEKMRIFSKMTSIQEKIIDMLDRLRISLVELSLPDGHVEVKLRERNAFEFSVRFSRNFLFPLGRMIEELRVSPKEDFQSAMTNEPCVKVCGIYGLLQQALQSYHKQLRHFFTDSVPKKLDILLNMITETTKTCLQKKIFDQRDTLIQCLLLRCSLFTEFVMKFAEQKRYAKEEESPLKSNRRDQYKLPKTSSKWELTMNLNNLNMYEPKLVPKTQKKKHHKKHTPTARHSHRNRETRRIVSPLRTTGVEKYDNDDGYSLATQPTDPDETQVRLTKVDNVESVQIFNSVVEEQPESELTRTLIEALQNITKDEVRQMLGPIFLNLDSILRNTVSQSKNFECV